MARTNVQRQAAWRGRQKEARGAHRDVLERWQEHNRFIVTKQADGGYKVGLETSPEGERLTAELAALCGLDPDAFLQRMVAELLVEEYGGRFVPAKGD